MRTEADIRHALHAEPDDAALARLTAFADDLDTRASTLASSTLASSTLHSVAEPRRRVVPLLAAATAVVVLAGGVAAVVGLVGSRGGTAPGGDPQLSAEQRRPTWNLRVAAVTGYTVTRYSASSIGLATGSLFMVAATDTRRPEQGVLQTCPGGALLACTDRTAGEQPVTVAGRSGLFTPGQHVERGNLSRQTYRRHPWQAAVADDRHQAGLTFFAGQHTVVFLTGTFGFRPATHAYDNDAAERIMLRIAAAISAGRHDAAYLPFALRNLPGRVAPESVLQNPDGRACAGYGTGPRGVHDPLGEVFTACRVPTGTTRAATVRAADTTDTTDTYNGPGRILGGGSDVVVHDFPDATSVVVSIDAGRTRVVSRAQAIALGANADVSPDPADPASWLVVR